MGFCKPMSEEVPLINTKTISKEELDAQRENAAKVQAVLQSRYTDKPLACVITYGCQQNVADSEHIKGMLADMGYAFTDDRHKAQFILFNTCAVREHAEDRVFGNVGALKSYKAEHPDTVIALCALAISTLLNAYYFLGTTMQLYIPDHEHPERNGRVKINVYAAAGLIGFMALNLTLSFCAQGIFGALLDGLTRFA